MKFGDLKKATWFSPVTKYDKVWILYQLSASSWKSLVRWNKKKPILWEWPLENGRRLSSHSWVCQMGEFAQDKCGGKTSLCYRRQARVALTGQAAAQTLRKILACNRFSTELTSASGCQETERGGEGRKAGTSVKIQAILPRISEAPRKSIPVGELKRL